MEYNLLTINK